MDQNLLQTLIELETSLHSEAIRKSKDKLKQRLHDDCIEIGASGKRYNKTQIIDSLLNETARKIKASDFALRELAPELMQLTYQSETLADAGKPRCIIRSSLWKKTGKKTGAKAVAHWQLIFHQGSVLQENK